MFKKKKIGKRAYLWAIIILVTLFIYGNLFGRNNFRYEEVQLEINNLPEDLDGLRIVQISDLHLGSFRTRRKKLESVYNRTAKLDADIIVNTGDFVSYNYHEMERFTGLLALTQAKYGKFAIPGNHDSGYYDKDFRDKQDWHLRKMQSLVQDEGFIWLSDSTARVLKGSTLISISGVSISGRIPFIKYGNIEKAMKGSDSADFNIVLSHDPKHWTEELQFMDIDLTLSGHTHGMQLGIFLPWLKISPARLLFKHWYGLYNNGDNYLYVNRGLGTMGPPLRIGMPPEVTIITLCQAN